jgi:gentisate 1,2-dioxygenase
MFHYPWTGVCAALAAMEPEADGSRKLRYTNPVDGGPVVPTMDLYALQLSANSETRPARTTSNAICVVVEGEGVSNIGDKRINWQKNDIFTLPHWTWISHVAASDGVKLFLSTDREVLKRLSLLRDEVQD